MRILLTVIAVVLSIGAAFDLLITLDLLTSARQAASVADYLETGAPILAWAAHVLAGAIPDSVLSPVLSLPPDWFFPVRALALGLCAVLMFAALRARQV